MIGITTVAEPALPAGKRFWRAILTAVASAPLAWVTLPDSSYVTVTVTLLGPLLEPSVAAVGLGERLNVGAL